MPTINNFSGGIATDIRELSTNKFALVKNFDIYSQDRLIPYKGLAEEVAQSPGMTSFRISDVVYNVNSSDTGAEWGLGVNDESGIKGKIFKKVDGTFMYMTGNTGTSIPIPGTLINYNQKLYFLCKSNGANATELWEFDTTAEALTYTKIGTVSDYNAIIPRPFVHPTDSILYIAAGHTIAKYDGSNFMASAKAISDASLVVTSLTQYDLYLAISCAPNSLGRNSLVLLWGRDTSLSLFQASIDFGEGALMMLENIGGTLIGISGVELTGLGSSYVENPRVIIRGYSGGSAQEIKSLYATGEYTGISLSHIKARLGDKLYFVMGLKVQNVSVVQLWILGKDKNGSWFMSPDRSLRNDTAIQIGSMVRNFNFIGDHLFVAHNDYTLMSTSTTYPNSTYDSLINPNMAIEDRGKRKKLKAVSVTSMTGGAIIFKYRFGLEAWATILSEALAANSTMEATAEVTGQPFGEGVDLQFEIVSSGTDIVEFKYDYEVIKTQI
ncbi:MAG: hypothetical protein WCQ96_03105 [Patescibacteria group bacterium]